MLARNPLLILSALAFTLPLQVRAGDPIEPNAGTWRTWVISSGRDYRGHVCRGLIALGGDSRPGTGGAGRRDALDGRGDAAGGLRDAGAGVLSPAEALRGPNRKASGAA